MFFILCGESSEMTASVAKRDVGNAACPGRFSEQFPVGLVELANFQITHGSHLIRLLKSILQCAFACAPRMTKVNELYNVILVGIQIIVHFFEDFSTITSSIGSLIIVPLDWRLSL